MPTASWILLCLIVGHAVGAAGGSTAAVAGVATCLAVSVHRRHDGRFVIAACVALFAAGWMRAAADRMHLARCAASLVVRREIEFVTDFDLAPGDAGPAVLRAGDGRCQIAGLVRARTPVSGGRWYRVTSTPAPAGRRLAVTASTVTALEQRSLRATVRTIGVRRVDSVFTRDAPMARALLLADMHLIHPDVRTRWSRAGLVHLLSVSGVHVAIIAGALLLLGRTARLSLRTATLLALTLTAVYVVILGAPPPAVRAAVMFGAILLARLRQRPASVWSVLTLGALLPVGVDPAAPIDLGWQLSVLGVASLAASGILCRRLGWDGGGWQARLRREFTASTVASLASAPLVVWYFGTVSLIAPFANLIAAPIVTLLQPTLFLALLCAPNLAVARFVAGAAHPALAAVDGVATVAAGVPGAAIALAPTLREVLLAGVVVGALLCAVVMRDNGRALMAAGIGVMLVLWDDVLPVRGAGALELHVLDVGQGDAIAVRTPRGRWIAVDAGGGPPGIDHGRRTVAPYLRQRGGELVAFILSHPHLDHVGGAPALIGLLRPRFYYDGAFVGGTEAYRASLESAAVHRVQWRRVHPGDTLRIDDVTFRFLAPDSAWTAGLDDANLASTIVRVEYGAIAMLLVGDSEKAEEEWLLAHTRPELLRADILKVGHHGSRTSSSPALLDAVAPRVAVVSVGRRNRYGHPAPDVLEEFARRQIPVLRTDAAGTTVVRTDGRTIQLSTVARQWSLPLPAHPVRSSPAFVAP